MTKKQFTYECSEHCSGVIGLTAGIAYNNGQHNKFVSDMLQQDSDAPSGTEYVLGARLYKALQQFKKK
jgi:hypothetical protein